MMSVDEVRHFSLSLPKAEEHGHWGKPSFRIRNKIFAVVQEDGVSVVIKVTPEDKAAFTTMEPATYQIPPTFSNMNYMIVRLDLVDPVELRGLILKAWKSMAPKLLVKQYEERKI